MNRMLVFVGGLHRSGTTLLARALGEHPAVSIFAGTGVPADEGQHLQSLYPTARVYGGPGAFGFASEAHLTESSPLVTETNRERLLAEWGAHWDLEKPVLLEKSPPNLVRTRFLQALFPGSRFVIIVRHPVPVSLATQKWRIARRRSSRRNRLFSKSSLRSLLRHWLVCHEIFARDAAALEHVHVVRYEDLVAEPGACVAALQRFLRLEHVSPALEMRTDSNSRYFAAWREREATPLGRIYAAALRRSFEGRGNVWGYSLNDLDRVDPISLRFRPEERSGYEAPDDVPRARHPVRGSPNERRK